MTHAGNGHTTTESQLQCGGPMCGGDPFSGVHVYIAHASILSCDNRISNTLHFIHGLCAALDSILRTRESILSPIYITRSSAMETL